jgi:lipopolysaccharide export system protein LptA
MKQRKIVKTIRFGQNFSRKHGVKTVMLAPVLLAVIFFTYSTVSAFFTINSSKMPDNFETIKFEVNDYNVQHIDPLSNKLTWDLMAHHASLDKSRTKAKIVDPFINYYDKLKDKVEFVLSSKHADIDKEHQSFVLYDQVELAFTNKDYYLESGMLTFSEDSDSFEVDKNWSLKSKLGYKIKGSKGQVSKNFDKIYSEGLAELTSEDITLKADQIEVKVENTKPQVQASGHSVLNLAKNDSTLTAQKIAIINEGEVQATGEVKVLADNIECHSSNMLISYNARNERVAQFTGAPYIIRDGNTIYADKIDYNFKNQQVTVSGNVHSG